MAPRGLAARAAWLLVAAVAAAKPATPRFKWGQTKELVFLSVMVRDLDPASVAVSLPDGDLRFRAKNAKGEEQALDLPLREDVEDDVKFEVAARPDKWGTATVITLSKVHKHRWDILVQDPKKFKGLMDKDWSREDGNLELEVEVPYVEDNGLLEITSKNLNKTLGKFSPLIVNVRYPWCTHCKSQDDTFAKAAKLAKKDKQMKKVGFGVVDAREERRLGRQLGAKCEMSCEYRVFIEPGEEPNTMKSQYSEGELVNAVRKYLGPTVNIVKSDADLASFKDTNTTCFGNFASEASAKYRLFKKVAGIMRGELVFAAKLGTEGSLEVWPHKQNFSFKYDGSLEDNGTALYQWLRPRSVPLLQEYDWQLRETYEKLGLPIAKVWINDEAKNPSFDKVVRHVVRRVAKKFIGRIAFVSLKKSTQSYELRDFGMDSPEVYPSFAIANNVSFDSTKYAFEVTPDMAPSPEDFWKDNDKAIERLTAFCDSVLAGTWPQAHLSQPPQTDWEEGTVRKLTWKSYKEIENPERPLLLEVYGKYRMENDRKKTEATNLATAVKDYAASFTVASYDSTENYLPPQDFKRDKYVSDTEWYWIPAKPSDGGARPPAKKLMKPKKDAPIRTVVEFAAKSLGTPTLDIDAVMAKFEQAMKENPPPPPPAPRGGDDFEDDGDAMGSMGGFGDMGSMGDPSSFSPFGGGMEL